MVSTIINVHTITIEQSTDIALTIIPASEGPEPKKFPTFIDINSTITKMIKPNIKCPILICKPPSLYRIAFYYYCVLNQLYNNIVRITNLCSNCFSNFNSTKIKNHENQIPCFFVCDYIVIIIDKPV